MSDKLARYSSLAVPLLAWSAASLLAVLFVHLGSEVAEGETRGFDLYFLRGALALRTAHPWVTEVMRDLSGLGSTVSLALLTIGACGYIALTTSWRRSAVIAVCVGAGAVCVELLKFVFGRARPDSELAQFFVAGLSFPSGHSSMAAIVFLTLAALVAQTRDRLQERLYLLCSAALLTVLVGISRAALGVHWPTDVLGGWAFGTAWATMSLLIAKHFDRSAPSRPT